MTTKRSGLGRNLSALLGQSGQMLLKDEPPGHQQMTLAIGSLQPGKYQPRGAMEDKPLDELALSIKKQGILQPLIVRQLNDGRYEIIAGERRWRAAQLAGLQNVPVVLKQVDDETAMAIALVENLQREDLNAMDQARAMERLVSEFMLTHQQVADLLGKSRTAVSNFLRLMTLSLEVKRLVEHGDIEMGHARALLSLDKDQQLQASQLIISRQLSVREAEKLVARLKSGKNTESQKTEVHPALKEQVQVLASHLNAKVKLKPAKSGKGHLVIHYNSPTNLEAILKRFTEVDVV